MRTQISLFIGLVLMAEASPDAFAGPTFSAAGDFSTSANPNGPWRYLYRDGSTTSLFAQNFSANADVRGWINDNSLAIPNRAFIGKNFGSTTSTYAGTVYVQPNTLNMDGERFDTIVRFIAPTAGTYSIAGFFSGNDTFEQAHNVEVVQNSVTFLFAPTQINTFGQMVQFSSVVNLGAGDTLDFIQRAAGNGTNLSTGFNATITDLSAVPEPSSLLMLGTCGVVGVGLWRRSRR